MSRSTDDVLRVAFQQAYRVFRDNPFTILANTALFLVAVVVCGITVVGLLAVPGIVGGYVESMLRAIRGQDQAIGRFISAGFVNGRWQQLLGIWVLHSLGTVFGFMLLVIPGLYLSIVWTFVWIYAVDKNTKVIESFTLSRKLVHADSNFSVVTLVMIFSLIVSFAVARFRPLAFLWAFLATPYFTLLTCSLYEQFLASPTRLISKSSH